MRDTDDYYKRGGLCNNNENTYDRAVGSEKYIYDNEWTEYAMQHEDIDMIGYDVYGRWYIEDFSFHGSKIG